MAFDLKYKVANGIFAVASGGGLIFGLTDVFNDQPARGAVMLLAAATLAAITYRNIKEETDKGSPPQPPQPK